MASVVCESKLHSVVRSSMHPCPGNLLAIRHAVVDCARLPTHLVQELIVGTVRAFFNAKEPKDCGEKLPHGYII